MAALEEAGRIIINELKKVLFVDFRIEGSGF